MTAQEIRQAYLKFFADRGHVVVPRANLVPQEDSTTLFTNSGMQPMVPYLLGQTHPAGDKLTDSQPTFRADDIDDVGDNRHTTQFEMLGNWGLGSYYKAEQLPWLWEFLTSVINLDPQKLFVTTFVGDSAANIAKDTESVEIWQKLFAEKGIDAKVVEVGSEADGYANGMREGRIFAYDASKNWWSRAGVPSNMPAGEPGGPDSEVFYDLGTEHDPKWGEHCHLNCDCGRFIEIANSVFMQYVKQPDGSFSDLPNRNVDFGGGLERIAMAAIHTDDIFKISLMCPIIEKLEQISGKSYDQETAAMRIIADHLRATTFLAVDGVVPSNTAQGYVMRRFIRRAIRQALTLGLNEDFTSQIVPIVVDIYKSDYPEMAERAEEVKTILAREESQFRRTLVAGLRQFERLSAAGFELTGENIFRLFDTYGFPVELTLEELAKEGKQPQQLWQTDYERLMTEQKARSRTATVGQFKGGLADHSDVVVKYHTATHLMYKALRKVLGDHVIQRGSNITPERLRFDFSHGEKMTPEQVAEVEQIVNEAIEHDWPMGFREIPTKQAFDEGALGAFGDKYGESVKVYTAGDPEGEWYSKEICGGPHVEHTGLLAEGGMRFKIKKEESSSAGVRRIKAVLE